MKLAILRTAKSENYWDGIDKIVIDSDILGNINSIKVTTGKYITTITDNMRDNSNTGRIIQRVLKIIENKLYNTKYLLDVKLEEHKLGIKFSDEIYGIEEQNIHTYILVKKEELA